MEGGDRTGEESPNGYRVSLWDHKNIVDIDSHDGCTTL